MGKGWHNEKPRHQLAAKGVKTKNKQNSITSINKTKKVANDVLDWYISSLNDMKRFYHNTGGLYDEERGCGLGYLNPSSFFSTNGSIVSAIEATIITNKYNIKFQSYEEFNDFTNQVIKQIKPEATKQYINFWNLVKKELKP
jgi:hypothetical protein